MKHVLYTLFIVLPLLGMEKSPVPNIESLYEAIQKNDIEYIREVINKDKLLANASFASCKALKEHTGECESPLLFATKENRKQIVSILLAAGADVDGAAQNSLTPLLCAILNQRIKIAEKLIERGANTHIKIHMYQGTYVDALALAKKMGLEDIHNQILKKRRELNHQNQINPRAQPELTQAN